MRYYYLIFGLFLFACHEQNNNKVSTAELMKSREIKKVSDAEVLKKGEEIGNEILQAILEIASLNVNADTVICEIDSWKSIDSLEAVYQTRIERVNRNSKLHLELELQLLTAYQYNLENYLKPTVSIQKLDSKTILFAYPIDSENNIYIFCMDSVSQKNAEMWSLKIPIKEIINKL